ncbi:MAG: hypothetical protein AAF543_21380, partial [Pseudomonadota bacterium]
SSTRILEFNGHKERVRNAVFSPDGITILTVSEDRTAKLWDGTDGRPLRSFEGGKDGVWHREDIWAAAFSPVAPTFVTGSVDGKLLLNWRNGERPPLSLIGHGDNIRSAEFSADGRLILTSSWDRTVRLWDASTGMALAVMPNEDIILDATFDPSGSSIAYAIRNLVRIRPIYPSPEALIAAAKAVKPRDLSPDERRLYLLDE